MGETRFTISKYIANLYMCMVVIGVRLHCVIKCCREFDNSQVDTHKDGHTSQPSTTRRDLNRTWSKWTDFDKPSSQLGSRWWNGSGMVVVNAKARFLTLILPRSPTGTVWFYTSTSNKRAARPKLYTKSLTRDLKCMYSRFTLVRISINL
jgi:hypothetical protein